MYTKVHQVPAWKAARRSPSSEPSLASRPSEKSGHFGTEPAAITSKWGIGWQTPTLMLVSYVLALAIAITHLALFRYLNGKEADGPNEVAPQSYISTASNVLANMFGFFLRAALAVAFVQYLWFLLRQSAMKVSTIELLFSIRSNPFILLRPAVLRAAPMLFALSIVMWTSQIVTSFPPGAITVTTASRTSNRTVVVPTFNASFMGNGSGVDANTFSLSKLSAVPPGGFEAQGIAGNQNSGLVSRLAFQVLVAGEAFALPSPCGANCSYSTIFEAPYLDCNHSSTNITINGSTIEFLIYNGTWLDPHTTVRTEVTYNGTFTLSRFTSSTFAPLSANADAFFDSTNGSVTLQQDRLICIPGRASFAVEATYRDNILSRSVKTDPISPLINLAPSTHDGEVSVPGFGFNGTSILGTQPANWSSYALSYYRDNNIMAIIDAMMLELTGSFKAQLDHPTSLPSAAGPVDDSVQFEDLNWDKFIGITTSTSGNDNAALNGTIIESTRLNTAFGNFSVSDAAHPEFNVTQDLLNEFLLNMTISIMIAFGQWSTTANATVSTTINVFSFSQPLKLIIPYFVTLLIALPFVLVGGIALHYNGVPAIDGGFIQTVMTTTGSAIIDKAAAGGCLGGEESAPQEFKDLKIKFGEIIDREEPGRIKRAGFGVDSEISTLRRGDNYGIARWI